MKHQQQTAQVALPSESNDTSAVIAQILENAQWGDPEESTEQGRKFTRRTAAPPDGFWGAYKPNKEAFKGAGLWPKRGDRGWILEWRKEVGADKEAKDDNVDMVGKLPPSLAIQPADDWENPNYRIEMVSVELLTANPLNKNLYSPDLGAALLASVEVDGVKVPVRALRNGMLIDGHRRVAIARQTGWKVVPVIFVDIPESDQLEAILGYNSHRLKSVPELLREYRAYLAIEKRKARERAGMRTDKVGWTPFSNQQERKISSGMRE